MSYILEALKKSQAERQLGNAPTIHAIPLDVTADAAAGGRRERLWMALAAGALVLGALALWTWRQQAQPVAPGAAVVPAPAIAAPPPMQRQGQGAAPAAYTSAAVVQPTFVPNAIPAPVAGASPVAVVRAAPPAPAAAPRKPEAVAAAGAAVPAAGAEDNVRTLRELPEAIQREVPQVAIGGYIYSKNPADRLLLVDKVLRREGEQVGPGLTLEKLLPKAAVMNYRGYRYRVPY